MCVYIFCFLHWRSKIMNENIKLLSYFNFSLFIFTIYKSLLLNNFLALNLNNFLALWCSFFCDFHIQILLRNLFHKFFFMFTTVTKTILAADAFLVTRIFNRYPSDIYGSVTRGFADHFNEKKLKKESLTFFYRNLDCRKFLARPCHTNACMQNLPINISSLMKILCCIKKIVNGNIIICMWYSGKKY